MVIGLIALYGDLLLGHWKRFGMSQSEEIIFIFTIITLCNVTLR